jgi:tetratricopeptide (TPR) repeat protein
MRSMDPTLPLHLRSLLLGGLSLLLAAAPARSLQQRQGASQELALAQAVALEAAGDLEEAAVVLYGILGRYPRSTRALHALERVMRSRGALRPIFVGVDRQLQLDPADSGAWFFKLRMMAELDSLGTIETEARRWVRADPESPAPYGGIAHLYEGLFGPQRALVVLREGREALGDPDAFAIEIGGALLDLGRVREAVEEWGRVVAPDRLQRTGDPERVGGSEAERAALVGALVEVLTAELVTTDQRRAGVWIAMRAGLLDEAWRLAARVEEDSSGEAAWSFLVQLAREAEGAGAPGLALRAYQRLRELSGGDSEERLLDVRIVRAALDAGQHEVAEEAEGRALARLPNGSPERRVLMAHLIEVEARHWLPETAAQRVEAFRDEYPEAPEVDRLAARAAAALQERGEVDAARRILEGVHGPESSLERAYLMLDEEAYEEAGEAFSVALPVLVPADATAVVQLMTLIDRLQPAGRALAAESAVLARRGRVAAALDALTTGLGSLPGQDQAALLAHAARMAEEAGMVDEAAELRDELVTTYPDAPEVEEATLALARHRARRDGDVNGALQLLETLIFTRPNAAVVPDARREMERLRREGTPVG